MEIVESVLSLLTKTIGLLTKTIALYVAISKIKIKNRQEKKRKYGSFHNSDSASTNNFSFLMELLSVLASFAV